MSVALIVVAVLGWLVAAGCLGYYWFVIRTHVCPIEVPTRAVLVSKSGLPESIRTLRGAAPLTYSRPRGPRASWIYVRVGNAAVYQTDAE